MENKDTFFLNITAILGFILYAVGIYLEVALLNKQWGNSAVDYSIQLLGPLIGVILVVLVGAIVLIITFILSKNKSLTLAINVYLCWFWILSLYQCAINSFLSYNNLPNEPINFFFKMLWPTFWYPVKELFFILISIGLLYLWQKKKVQEDFTKLDIILILMISILLISATVMSQLTLINSEGNVYS